MARLLILFSELLQLLEEERTALLSGSPEVIADVADRKRELAAKIEEATPLDAARPDPELLRRLARSNRANSVICSEMLRHMTQGLDRLRQREPHRSYRADGSERNPPARNTLGAA